MPTLTIHLPGLPPVEHVLKENTITIGRMEGNTIVIDDASVSTVHARITKNDREFLLRDLNSTNGTLVNGQVIREARLKDGDRVRFADITAEFKDEAVVAPPQPVAVAVVTALKVQQAPVPAGSPAPPPAPRPQALPAPRKLVSSIVPLLGGVAALAFVSFLLIHANRNSQEKSPKPAPPVASSTNRTGRLAGNKPGVTNAAAQSPSGAEGSGETLPQLVKALHDQSPAERRRAATALHSLGAGAKDATSALREALKDTDDEVRMWSALTLINNECYDKATIPILVKALQNDNPDIRQVAGLSLGLIPYDPAEKEVVVPALTQAAGKDPDGEVRKAALSALDLVEPGAAAKAGLK